MSQQITKKSWDLRVEKMLEAKKYTTYDLGFDDGLLSAKNKSTYIKDSFYPMQNHIYKAGYDDGESQYKKQRLIELLKK